VELNLATAVTSNTAGPLPTTDELRINAGRYRTAQILVVDDEAQVRLMILAMLEREGYGVHLATSGRNAMDMLEQSTFDLVLTDIAMTDGSGIVLLEYLRREQPHVPVVMATAIHDIGVAIDAMRRGAYDYLLKPFDCEHLSSTVKCALDYGRALRENHSYQQNLQQLVRTRTEMLCQVIEAVERSYEVALGALGDALSLKDPEAEGHSKRVTAYTIVLARALGISPADIKVIARGAFLHDIGKMAIPDDILHKPGRLTPEELDIIRDHCSHGYEMLRKIPSIAEVAEIVLTHHERYDGKGYPRGLCGGEIPIGSRILAVADALDAITSDWSFHKARSFDAAREEISRCSGSQFDSNVVEAFLKVPHNLWAELRIELTVGAYDPGSPGR
jgi:putative nucleotidyltransferase with HDIG domain